MIAYLRGTILQKTLQFIILNQSGVGYKIFTTPEILELPIGKEVELYIHHKSSDDGQTLFGMADFDSLLFFENTISNHKRITSKRFCEDSSTKK